MMAVEMSGGVYCPLSPRDPKHRLHDLLQQTQSLVVLTHFLTKTIFNESIISLDIDSILTDSSVEIGVDVDRLSKVAITTDSLAYTIFTSGSTGTPKAVSNKPIL